MPKTSMRNKNISSRRTKIIATIGPSTSSLARIKSLLTRGVNIFRVNFSHGDYETHRESIANIRHVAKELNTYTAVLADLCGPKIRTGTYEPEEIILENGQLVTVTTRDVIGNEGLIPCQYKNLHKDMEQGQRILLDDGKMELKVIEIQGRNLLCEVVYGGVLSAHKGMNLPDTSVSSAALTAKDKQDLVVAIECDVDFVALSFVRSQKDIQLLIKELAKHDVYIPIVAKIERPEAIENIDEILKSAYGIMIARGDLGIELAAEKIPLLQNTLIDKARLAHKPVIVATQMLESMITSSRPTRAEVSDVASATVRSADALMLSGETSVGKYPLQAVEYMDKIIREIEQNEECQAKSRELLDISLHDEDVSLREAMSRGAMGLAKDLDLQALVVPTSTGRTARIVSSYRPSTIIIGVSHYQSVCRKLSIHWGVEVIHMNPLDFQDWKGLLHNIQENHNFFNKNDKVLMVAGFGKKDAISEPVLKLLFCDQ
ncbi:MAG: pyruvate kinase [Gammaproteobacteria bacterium]|nr:pyruvate kinase [Gammaproteobacteria bacterium]